MMEILIILTIIALAIALTIFILLVQYDMKKAVENITNIYIDIANVTMLINTSFKRIDELKNEIEKLKGE